MEYMTTHSLRKVAPASSPRPASARNGLTDTSAFLSYIARERGYKPFLAAQGTAHKDATKVSRETGRHLVVAANSSMLAMSILNGHTTDRKNWVAFGVARGGVFLTHVAIGLARHVPFSQQVDELWSHQKDVLALRSAMDKFKMVDPTSVSNFATRVAEMAYLNPKSVPAPTELMKFEVGCSLSVACAEVLKILMAGNLAPRDGKRRLKAIKGPEALLHASSAVWHAALSVLPGELRPSGELPARFIGKV